MEFTLSNCEGLLNFETFCANISAERLVDFSRKYGKWFENKWSGGWPVIWVMLENNMH